MESTFLEDAKSCAIHEAIEELEKQRWIPVSERLPDTTDEVLVTDGVDMMVAWHDYTLVGWASFDSNFDTDVPIKAWTPLPQPYKAEGEE